MIPRHSERTPEAAKLRTSVLDHDRLGERAIALSLAGISVIVIVLHCLSAVRNDWQSFNVWIIGLLCSALVICAARLWLSRRPKFPELALGILTVIEISVFMFLIWSYQFAHDHPASGVLKAPSIVFLFVLIGVRAMRFHPLPALVAGCSVIVGWSLMTIGAGAFSTGPDANVTSSYSAYLVGEGILIGAEIEKLIGFAALTAIIAFSVSRARELIARAAQIDIQIEARQRAELLLEKSEAAGRAKSDFLAVMSHELRTPLNAIQGFSELMLAEINGPVEPPAYKEYVGDIHCSGRHLLGIINEVLEFSGTDRTKEKLQESRFDLHALVNESCRVVEHGAPDRRVSIAISSDSPEGELFGDRKRIKQALINLIGNAVKFTQDDGSVTIWWHHGSAEFVLGVRDTGIGVPADKVALISEPFQQVESAHSRKFGGVGLGLAIVKQIANDHGGSLGIESTLGVGTSAYLTLPDSRWIGLSTLDEVA